jgi:hypothetical protein
MNAQRILLGGTSSNAAGSWMATAIRRQLCSRVAAVALFQAQELA